LIGISVDRSERNCRFADAEGLEFSLIGDESRVISERYGVVWPVLKIDRRATFVIDLQGVIEEVIHHELQVYRHLEDVLDRLAR
jgi:thioredoxin-dependent peroxiredoxin